MTCGSRDLRFHADIALNRLSCLNDLVDVLRHNLEVYDTSPLLHGSSLSAGSEFGNIKSHAVVEAAAERDDEIGLLHSHVGVGSTVHSEHVQRLVVELVEGTEALEGGGDGDGGLVGQFTEELGGAF